MLRLVRKRQRAGLAAELVGSLFCGLPRIEKRMAVFVAAADESDAPTRDGAFLYGGFVAPFVDWHQWFTPAWEERVLNKVPPNTVPPHDRHSFAAMEKRSRNHTVSG